MAIHINPTNINPNVGNTFEAGYKARMAEKQPWIDARNNILKDIGEVAKLGLASYLNTPDSFDDNYWSEMDDLDNIEAADNSIYGYRSLFGYGYGDDDDIGV